jgi:hypothetical protein
MNVMSMGVERMLAGFERALAGEAAEAATDTVSSAAQTIAAIAANPLNRRRNVVAVNGTLHSIGQVTATITTGVSRTRKVSECDPTLT